MERTARKPAGAGTAAPRWIGRAALAAACVVAGLIVWPGPASDDPVPGGPTGDRRAASRDGAADPRLVAAGRPTPAPGDFPWASVCGGRACDDAPPPGEAPAPARERHPTLVADGVRPWAGNADAWALDPQPIAPVRGRARPLVNRPPVPDESDPTPGVESNVEPQDDEGADPSPAADAAPQERPPG